MRIGVDYRILAVGAEMITRGMGRYTQQQLREVLAVDDRNEYVLLCNHGTDLSLILPEILGKENVSLQLYRNPRGLPAPPGPEGDLMRRAEHYQDWVHHLDLDVYHATTPFLLQYPLLQRFDACPLVSTFYDLIPPLFPDRYFHNGAEFKAHYMRTLTGLIKGADRLLAISDSAAQDAIDHLGIPAERIDRAWPIPEGVFRPLPRHLANKLTFIMQDRFRLPERYALTVSFPHYAKNLETLLEAYALLPRNLRTAMPLVVCCHLDQHGRRVVQNLARSFGVSDDVVTSGLVTDEELCALYNGATMVIHPSRYEGFGLPVVEAMCCGAPVITTTASSLPEVAGDAAVLVDPEDPAAFAEAIRRLAADGDARASLRERGFAQASRFNRAQLAQATMASYARTVEGCRAAPAAHRLHLALWTPLPPLGSGIADYSEELLEGLSRTCDVEVFVDDGYLPRDDLLGRYPVQHFTGFERRAGQQPFDAVLYQVGGSMFHYYMTQALRDHPGIVVLHDLMWSHVLYTHYNEAGDLPAFLRLVESLEGRQALQRLLALAPGDLAGLWEFLGSHPMLQPVIADSLAQIVHLEEAADELRGAYPGARPWVVPMGVADPYAANPAMRTRLARARLGLDPEALIVSVFGIVHDRKRLESCIRAFAAATEGLPGGRTGVPTAGPPARLVIVGRWMEDSYRERLGRLARDLRVEDRVTFTGHVSAAELDAHLIATDIVLNLRTPFHTHMSATLMRAIAAARPVVITGLPEWDLIPEDACIRIPCDDTEVACLITALARLTADPRERRRLGDAARAFYERAGTISHMTSRYLEVIQRVLGPAVAAEAPGQAVPIG